MPVAQRKIFRIEEAARGGAPSLPGANDEALRHSELIAELAALRAALAPRAPGDDCTKERDQLAADLRKFKIERDIVGKAIHETKAEITSLQDHGFNGERAAKELNAVISGAEQTTERILAAAESIEEKAGMLASMLKSDHERSITQDIAESVTQIFEACNFHDLAGQRIAKIATTMALVQDHLARMIEIWSVIDQFHADDISAAPRRDSLLNGPKLEGDRGHSSQSEIDSLFP